MIMHDKVKYRTKSCGERAGKQRDRDRDRDRDKESVCVRERETEHC